MAFSTAGAAAGATAGSGAGPWGTAIGAVVGGFMGGSGSASGSASGGGAVATPQAAQAAAMGSGLDGSAWVVNFGNGNTTTLDNRQDKHIDSTGPTATANPSTGIPYSPYLGGAYGAGAADPLGLGALGLGGVPPILLIALVAVVILKAKHKK